MDANESAQDLRLAGALLQARARLAVCISPRCPGPVRADCVERLRDVEDATPTIVFEAVDARGQYGLAATLDGHPISSEEVASPIALDPGAHEVVFEANGFVPATVTVVVGEGEKNHRVEVPELTPRRTETRNVQRPAGLVVGGVGLAGLALGSVFAALAKSTDSHALNDECGGNPNTCSAAGAQDGQRAHAQATVSTIALIGGGVLLGAGASIYFTAPGTRRAAIRTTDGAGRAGLSFMGEF